MRIFIAILGFPFRLIYALLNVVIGIPILILFPKAWEKDGGWRAMGQLGWWALTAEPEDFWGD